MQRSTPAGGAISLTQVPLGAISQTLPLPLAQAFLGLSARWLHGTGAPGALQQRDVWLTIKLEHMLEHLK